MNNELNRINAVRRFKQLDAGITNDLNEIVNLAAQICNTPVALVTLIDEDMQWFKARKGVDIDYTDRKLAFCNHTIQQDGLMVVPDTSIDERFIDNTLVTDAPYVRFYAGATLSTKDGYNVGSLCVIDLEARELNEHQQNSLKILSKQVMNLMELNWSLHTLEQQHEETRQQKKTIEESEIKLNAIFNSSKYIHVLVNKNLEVLAFNKAAAAFVHEQYNKTLAIGLSVLEYTSAEYVERLTKHIALALTGEAIKLEWNMLAESEKEQWMELEFVPIKNNTGEIIGVALNSTDITDRKLQEDQINIQNAALTRIAIIQSHELRRPVASLLGIMALIKLEQTKGDMDYLDMLELTVKELDEKIKEIVKDSENTINNFMAIVA